MIFVFIISIFLFDTNIHQNTTLKQTFSMKCINYLRTTMINEENNVFICKSTTILYLKNNVYICGYGRY